MRLLVLADTHLDGSRLNLPEAVEKLIPEIDAILHAGDFTSFEFYKYLESRATVYAVYGNMDRREISTRLPQKRILKFDDISIGLVHSNGSPVQAIQNARQAFNDVNIIVFGHSHQPMNETRDGVLMFNPGSPTERRFSPFNSFGLIEIQGGEFKAKIIPLEV